MHMRVLLALFLISLSGCADVLVEPVDQSTQSTQGSSDSAPADAPHTPETPARPAEPSEPAEPTEPARPVAAAEPHGDVRETWGPIGTKMDGTQWVAQRTVKLENGVGNADLIRMGLDLRYAEVTIVDDEVGGTTYDFILTVRGDTQQAAEEGLRNVDLHHSDSLQQGTLTLSTAPAITNFVVAIGNQPSLSYQLDIHVPWHIAHEFDIETAYTELAVGAFFGPAASIDARYSDLTTDSLEVAELAIGADYSAWTANVADAQRLAIDARYSEIEVRQAYLWELDVTAAYSDVWVGDLRLHGEGVLDARYSEIHLDVPNTGGYDVAVDMRYSQTTVDLPELEVIEEDDDRLHVRTIGFTGKNLQADIDAELSYSDLRID